jgi:hypothetical protein
MRAAMQDDAVDDASIDVLQDRSDDTGPLIGDARGRRKRSRAQSPFSGLPLMVIMPPGA